MGLCMEVWIEEAMESWLKDILANLEKLPIAKAETVSKYKYWVRSQEIKLISVSEY